MKISKQGITFSYNNDFLLWFWWWNRKHGIKWYSTVYEEDFTSLKEYWKHIGKNDNAYAAMFPKIAGMSFSDALCSYAQMHLREGYFVILSNINIGAKPAIFWRSIPEPSRKAFSQEVVILKCKDRSEMEMLCRSIETSFADALGFQDGRLIDWNENDTPAHD